MEARGRIVNLFRTGGLVAGLLVLSMGVAGADVCTVSGYGDLISACRSTAGPCNPATQPQPADVRATLADLLADGTAMVPGIGSDIADPDAVEVAYPDTPVAALLSFFDEGLAPLTDRFGELSMPLLLWTSRQDHVVDPAQSEHLATTYGGPVDHRWLDRSYHVATQDFDRDVIFVESIQWMDARP